MIQFGEWLPDQPQYNGGTTLAKNVLPSARGYDPLPSPTDISDAASLYIRGTFAAQNNDLVYDLYAGTETKLLRFDRASGSLVDVSRTGGYATGTENRWRFTQYGQRLIAANYDDNIQTIPNSSTGDFSDLVSIKAKHVDVVGEFLITGYVNDTDGETPYRVRWSAIGDPTDFTVSQTTQADFQDIPNGGAVTGIVGGGQVATIMMERQIVRLKYAGLPVIFEVDITDQQRGCAYQGGFANVGTAIYYLAHDGFYVYNGESSRPIGAERVNQWFFDRFNPAYANRLSCAADPKNQVIAWAFASNESDAGEPDLMLLYNYAVDQWSYAEISVDTLSSLLSSGYTLEQLDDFSTSLDAITVSLDSGQWEGGELFFGGARDGKLISFNGTPLTATLETPEFEVAQGRHGLITEVHPYYDGIPDAIEVQCASRPRQNIAYSFNSASSLNDAGFCPVRSQGRYHKIRMVLTGGEWSNAQGVAHVTRKMGRR